MKEPKLELKEIELSQIDPNPGNAQLFNMTNIEHLANIIKEEGFTTPIEVFLKDDGRYEITSGHRRYEAMKLLGRKVIPCCITEKYESDTKRDRKLLSSNIATRKLSPYEMATAIAFYESILKKEKYKGNTRIKVAEYFGISESNVYRYKCILNLIPELQEFCKKPQFPYSSLRAAANLTPEEQKDLYDELLRLEAERISKMSGKEEVIDEIDKDEIIFTRTRIEQIINNKIRRKERQLEQKKEDEQKPVIDDSDSFMNEPVFEQDETEEDKAEKEFNLDDFIVKDSDDSEPVVFFEAPKANKDAYLHGLDECLTTLNAYKKNTNSYNYKREIKDKLAEIKAIIRKLEESLD